MGTVTEFTNMDFKTLVQLAFIFISGAVAPPISDSSFNFLSIKFKFFFFNFQL